MVLALEMLREQIKDKPVYEEIWSDIREVERQINGPYTEVSWDPQPFFYEEKYRGGTVDREDKKVKLKLEREDQMKLLHALKDAVAIVDRRISAIDDILKKIWEEECREAALALEMKRISKLNKRSLFKWRKPKSEELEFFEDREAKVILVYLTERIKAVITIRDTGKPGKKRWRLDAVLRPHRGKDIYRQYDWWPDLPDHWRLLGKVDGANRAKLREAKALIPKKQRELLDLIDKLEQKVPIPGKKPRRTRKGLKV